MVSRKERALELKGRIGQPEGKDTKRSEGSNMALEFKRRSLTTTYSRRSSTGKSNPKKRPLNVRKIKKQHKRGISRVRVD